MWTDEDFGTEKGTKWSPAPRRQQPTNFGTGFLRVEERVSRKVCKEQGVRLRALDTPCLDLNLLFWVVSVCLSCSSIAGGQVGW